MKESMLDVLKDAEIVAFNKIGDYFDITDGRIDWRLSITLDRPQMLQLIDELKELVGHRHTQINPIEETSDTKKSPHSDWWDKIPAGMRDEAFMKRHADIEKLKNLKSQNTEIDGSRNYLLGEN